LTTARTLTPRQVLALQAYARDVEAAARHSSASTRLAAQQVLNAAQAVLTPREIAILKVVVVGGRSIANVAAGSGRTAPDMEGLFLLASSKLADHYEARVSVQP
jgi:hypothetical protein